jgi:hypothetical protein
MALAQNNRDFVLLDKTIETYGHSYHSISTSVYSYREEGENLLIDEISTNINGFDSDPDFSWIFDVSGSITIDSNGKTYNYSMYYQDTNELARNTVYTINDQNKLVYEAENIYSNSMWSRTYLLKKIYNPSSGQLDSLFFSYPAATSYSLRKYEYDNLGRAIIAHSYSSHDSIDWDYQGYENIQYGSALPFHLNLEFPETMETQLIWDYINPDYQIASATIPDLTNNSRQTTYYTYTINSNSLSIQVGDNMSWSHEYTFDLNGFLTHYSNSPGTELEYTSHHTYHWGEYVHNQDEYITPNTISAFPNPFSSSLTLKLDNKDNIPSDISIYNLKGQLIRQWKQTKAKELSWDGKDINNNTIATGIYFLKVNQAGKIATHKKICMK